MKIGMISLIILALTVCACTVTVFAVDADGSEASGTAPVSESTEPEPAEDTAVGLDVCRLTYRVNFDDIYDMEGSYVLPSTIEMPPDSAVSVGDISYESLIATRGNAEYEVRFKCWNTEPDGSGSSYMPDIKIALKRDTVLYAQWEYTVIVGELELCAQVIEPDDARAPADTFTFRLTGSGREKFTYDIYNAHGDKLEAVSAVTPARIELRAGEYALLRLTPDDYTVEQLPIENYVTDRNFMEVSVVSGRKSSLVFESVYVEPRGSLVIHKNEIGEAHSFIFEINGIDAANNHIHFKAVIPEGEESVKISDLPMGNYSVTVEGEQSVGCTVSERVQYISLERNGDAASLRFKFGASDGVYWLSGDAYEGKRY